MRVRLLARGLCGLLPLVSGHGFAQVLHERVTIARARCQGELCAFVQDGQTFPAPEGGAAPAPGEQIFVPKPDTQVEVRADRDTGPEGSGTHPYHMVFNPEPLPYQRMIALDDVDGDGEALFVHDRVRRPLPVIGAVHAPERDRFWGSIVIDLEPERWVAIPSVSADPRILSYATTPPVSMEFAKDGADNLFVRSTAGGRHRLTWLSDAPRRYFGGDLPAGVRMSEIPAVLKRQVPERLKRRVMQVLARTGIPVARAKHAAMQPLLEELVRYFRAFELGALPPPSGSVYLDLAMAQKGSCRHRSFAFAITAMALGIPARYVENEVHVFVEVWVPRMGWRRVNLGGAPLDPERVGGEGKALYPEKGGDPFPKPAAFVKDAGAQPPKEMDGPEPRMSDGAKRPPRVDLEAIEREDAAADAPVSAHRPGRVRTRISIEIAEKKAFRGERVEVHGRVSAEGTDAGGLPVEVYLHQAGGAVKVGEAVSEADGAFHLSVEVPRNLQLGDHRVVARTRGDGRRAACTSSRP